jgi:hypothetical protein
MNNSELELELIQRFGLDATIKYAEMVSFMYELMCEDFMETNPGKPCDYEYEQQWWKNKHDELKKGGK